MRQLPAGPHRALDCLGVSLALSYVHLTLTPEPRRWKGHWFFPVCAYIEYISFTWILLFSLLVGWSKTVVNPGFLDHDPKFSDNPGDTY